MTEHRLVAPWLRIVAGLVAAAGLLALGGCGGGSGAPDNPFKNVQLITLDPANAVIYSGVPVAFTISGGTPPYKVFSSNGTVIPVAQSVAGSTFVVTPARVAADTPVTITVQDSGAPPLSVSSQVTVRASTLLNSLTIVPTNATECGANAICSGQTGTATVTALGAEGGPIGGRQIRFDVVAGPYTITTTNPGQPATSSLTVPTDLNGSASVIIRANVNAPTQFAQIRATDLTTGQQVTGNFLIQQVTDGSKVLTVVPNDEKITAFFKDECSSDVVTDYYIYGGTPPYRVTVSNPQAVTLLNNIVLQSGGFFRTITNGSCFDPTVFSIFDATGLQTTATLHNVVGTNERTSVPPPDLGRSPESYTDAACTGKTFTFSVFGGTPPYNVTATMGVVNPQIVTTTGGLTAISGLLTGSGVTSVVFLDSSTPKKSLTSTITCTSATSTPPPDLTATPLSYTSNACTSTSFPFAVFGGTPPYNVSSTRGTPSPLVIPASGGVTTITGLVTGTGQASVVFLDHSVPQKSFTATITCDPASAPAVTPPPALVVTDGFDYGSTTCVGQTSNFVITGGTPPYSIAFSAPLPPAGTITPSTVSASGGGLSVTGLIDVFTTIANPTPPPPTVALPLPYIAYLTITDAGTPAPQQAVRSIKCP